MRNRFYFFVLLFFSCCFLSFARMKTSDLIISVAQIRWLGQLEFLLAVAQCFYTIIFLGLLYSFFISLKGLRYELLFFWGFGFDLLLFFSYSLLVLVLLPSYIYINGIYIFHHFFVLNYGELMPFLPPTTSSMDFLQLCVEGHPIEKSQLPPMNGHFIVGGITSEGNSYLCADIRHALDKSASSWLEERGLDLARKVLKVPDVLCSGIEPSQVPKSFA